MFSPRPDGGASVVEHILSAIMSAGLVVCFICVTTVRCCLPAVVPAGWYLKAPGEAVPCPKGEWKSGVGADGNCKKCSYGVTTADVASVSKAECKSECRFMLVALQSITGPVPVIGQDSKA